MQLAVDWQGISYGIPCRTTRSSDFSLRGASLQVLHNGGCRGATFLGVDEKRDLVRPKGTFDSRERFYQCLDHRELTEHCGGEDVGAGALRDQVECNLPIPHVSRAAEGGLKVATAPVPSGVEKRRSGSEKFAGTFEIGVGGADELLHERRFKGRTFIDFLLLLGQDL